MSIVLTDSLKKLLIETASQLKGAAKRKFMAKTVIELSGYRQREIERELGWNRGTIRKGIKELKSGITCVDNYSAKGRKKAEEHLPKLLEDIKNIVYSQNQTNPNFKSRRLSTRLSAEFVRKELIENYSYSDEDLPTSETIRVKLHNLGYKGKRKIGRKS